MTINIPLTRSLKINQGSHILYFYNELEAYVDNAVSYILTGVELGHYIIYIDSRERCKRVMAKVDSQHMSRIHYVDSEEFYEIYQDFNYDRILSNLTTIIQPYVDNQVMVRLWGHVDWMSQDNIVNKLHTYESIADCSIAELGYTTVCAYNAQTVPAAIQTEMLRTHSYFMTDTELVRSTLYKSSNLHNPTIFPSLSIQRTVENEMDFYRQKLDFVHVVSHEVRNPLTVIQAYASLLAQDEPNEERRTRLQEIQNYAVVIDNEISHIINTEQMLSTDAFWIKTLIRPHPAIVDVVEIMQVKAITQNVRLQAEIGIHGNEMILGNTMGLKMIVSNLLSNAIKYSTEGSSVYLNVSKDHSYLTIEVKDYGVGMNEEQLQKLYQKYQKINQDQSGQGIGLFMVKKLVDHFEGDIQVQSQVNEGTSFGVRLFIQSQGELV